MNNHGGMMMNNQHSSASGNAAGGPPRGMGGPLGGGGMSGIMPGGNMGGGSSIGGGMPGGNMNGLGGNLGGMGGYGGPGGLGGATPGYGQGNTPLPQFDINDFPALGSLHNRHMGNPGAMAEGDDKGGMHYGGHQMAGPNSQPRVNRPEFAMHTEDFPALPGSSPSAVSSPLDTGLAGAGSTQSVLGDAIAGVTSSSMTSSSSVADSDKGSAASRWGLTGLLSVIRMTDPDLNTLALGTDLTTLGLNLNSTEVLYATFAYPCVDNPCRREPDYVLPYCYYMQPPALKTSHLSKFQLETLFYIFYNMPKDTLQVYAAKELYNRDWRYHKELKLWFTRDAAQQAQAGTSAPGGSYIYFDINSWERRLFRDTNLPGVLKFMTEEEHTLL